MNIKGLHKADKPVSAVPLFKSDVGQATAIQILKDQTLKEHITRIPAMLICMEGKAMFENEYGAKATLGPGDYVNIEPMVLHWVVGLEACQLLLIK